MKQASLIVLALLTAAISSGAQARKPAAAAVPADDYANKHLPEAITVWHCWYDGAIAVQCRLGERAEAAAAPAAAPQTDARLPGSVRQIWHRPAELADQLVTIPLHSIPFDMAFTGQLAEAVMCGGASYPCGVIFARNRALLADFVRLRQMQLAAHRLGRLALAD